MTVFKAFLKILNKCKFVVLLYTVFLIGFGAFNMQTSDNSTSFVASKPDILIINNDEEKGITKNLIKYLKDNANTPEVENNKEAIDDALFYREVAYIIYIPENYREDFLNGKNPEIEVKSTGDYGAAYAEMLLSRYINVANTYEKTSNDENELIKQINNTLDKKVDVEVTTKLDTNNLEKATFYFNFANYSLLAGCVYVICLILSSFKEEKIRKRTIISSMDDRKHNRILLLANSLFGIALWAIYVLISFILVGDVMFTMNGLLYIINSFIFTICSVVIALLIGNLIINKEAINGIVNVVALGSSFLCGAFVPMMWLPDLVLTIAHVLPSYYYISTNEAIKSLESFDFETLRPIFTNMIILGLFIIGFIIVTNIVSHKKRKIG
ncbi:MAG: ABC transporter permease [Bacilli bacterium]